MDAGKASAAEAAAAISQSRLEAALCSAIAHEVQLPPPTDDIEQRAAAGLFAAAAVALQLHAAETSTGPTSAAVATVGPTTNGIGSGGAHDAEAGGSPVSPLVAHCREHLQHVSARLLAMCDAGAQQPASVWDTAVAKQLISYLQAAVQTLQHQQQHQQPELLPPQQQPAADDMSEEAEPPTGVPPAAGAAPAAAAAAPGSHAALLQLHLQLLARLAPPPAAPPPTLQPGSSFWAGVPTAGAAGRVRRALLASLRYTRCFVVVEQEGRHVTGSVCMGQPATLLTMARLGPSPHFWREVDAFTDKRRCLSCRQAAAGGRVGRGAAGHARGAAARAAGGARPCSCGRAAGTGGVSAGAGNSRRPRPCLSGET